MGIVTNKMSDRVYQHLQHHADQNTLSSYLIQLVEADLEGTLIRDALQDIKEELDKMKQHLSVPAPEEKKEKTNTLVSVKEIKDDEVNRNGFNEETELNL